MTVVPIAIVANSLGVRSETFVARHLATLNGGRTVAVCRRIEGAIDPTKPMLAIAAGGRKSLLHPANLLRAIWNQSRWGGIALPSPAIDREIAAFLQQHGVSRILAEFGPLGCIVQNAAAIADIPLYVHFRGQDASSLLAKPGVRAAYRRLFPALAGVFAVSGFLLDNLRACGFVHPNAHVFPSGVDTDAFAPGVKDPGLILCVGRFVRKKSPELVIRAFAQIACRYSVRLEMIGDGPLLASCRQLAATLGIADRIVFAGACAHEIVRARMAAATILLQHSVTVASGETEGLPSVVQEGMAAGAVVIATRHAGIPEAIRSGENGLLVAEGDLDGFVAAIATVLDNPAHAETLALRARQDAVEHFDCRHLAGRLEDVLLG